MTMIEFRTNGEQPLAYVGLTDDELARLEFLMIETNKCGGNNQTLWDKIRSTRLEISRISRQLPVAMGGRRDYYEEHKAAS